MYHRLVKYVHTDALVYELLYGKKRLAIILQRENDCVMTNLETTARRVYHNFESAIGDAKVIFGIKNDILFHFTNDEMERVIEVHEPKIRQCGPDWYRVSGENLGVARTVNVFCGILNKLNLLCTPKRFENVPKE